MADKGTILCFASGYDAPPTSKHHVMHILAEDNVVLWVNYHASRTPSVSSSDMLYILRKLRQVFAGMSSPRANLYVMTPLVIPLPGSNWARKVNRWLLIRQVKRALRKIREGRLGVWSFTPDVSYVLGHFDESEVVYYCVDDHAAFSGYDREQVLRDEAELCRKADLVVTTSMALQEAKKGLNPNTMLVPHGVDYDHFSQAVVGEPGVPGDMEGIGRPRLGFFGLIRDWVDLELLAEVARRRSDWHIVLIGDSTVDLGPYRGLENVHFLGRKGYDELPGYCRQFDVGLIPFKVNELTHAVNPIKLREYMAAGLPVVSTPMPEVQLYDGLIRVADGVEEFTAAVEAVLADEPGGAKKRMEAMSKETWPAKVEQIKEALGSGSVTE